MKLLSLILVVLAIPVCTNAQTDRSDRLLAFGSPISDAWLYNAGSDVYYIVGIIYCASPTDQTYEQMGIFVPGAYMNATDNNDGTYTCTINPESTVNGYTASTAPVVVPINTPGYSPQTAPSGFSNGISTYTNAGFIYLWPGCRGRVHGAPFGVTDLKAAIRYFRYLQAEQNAVPGHTGLIFSFGHSGGGAQSSILGASGNSAAYNEYLNDIGAETDYGDNIFGCMCWCPITNLDQADAAYEWNMGLTRSSLSNADESISIGLATEFAEYINSVGFRNPDTGETLTLTATTEGYYQSGSYYEYIISVINEAIARYNSYHNTSVPLYAPTDTSALREFALDHKNATKGIGAFDDYNSMGTAENMLFGISGSQGHFDPYLADMVNLYAPAYYAAFTADLADTNVDDLGRTVCERVMAYTPLYYLIDDETYYNGGGNGSSDVARCWRIRSGIGQGDTALNTEINLALALRQRDDVSSVDFETIWGQGHTQAEDTGNSTTNFITWVEEMVTTVDVDQGADTEHPAFRLIGVCPNPFNPITTISYSLAETSHVQLSIYNIHGQLVHSLTNGNQIAGEHTAIWNGTDNNGVPVSTGVYFCRIFAKGRQETRKMLLLK